MICCIFLMRTKRQSSRAADGAVGADGADDAVSSLSCSHYAISRLVCIVANAARCRDVVAARRLADSHLEWICMCNHIEYTRVLATATICRVLQYSRVAHAELRVECSLKNNLV